MSVPGLQIFPDFGIPTSNEEDTKVAKPQQKYVLEEDGEHGNEEGEPQQEDEEEDKKYYGIF